VAEAGRAVELVLLQYQGGVTDFNRVFNAQTTLVQQQDQLAVTQGDIALRLIDVYHALGGGWRYFMGGIEPPRAGPDPAGANQQPAEVVPAPNADLRLNPPAKRADAPPAGKP
jgi:hypothetical protein